MKSSSNFAIHSFKFMIYFYSETIFFILLVFFLLIVVVNAVTRIKTALEPA